MDLSKVRNIGIAAHIDSGKTTLSERILYYTGRIHQMIEVRSKTGEGPTMDSMDLEREKGITIQSAATYCKWKDYQINLIDTPGHIDFTVEVERALRVLDGAILVLCGVAGVQSQSITVDRQMRRYNVPRIAFINKVDRAGANPDRVINQLEEKLNHKPVMITMPIGLEDNFKGVVDLIKMKAIYYEGDNGENVIEQEIPNHLLSEARKRRQIMIERIADYDDNIANKYLADEEISSDELIAAIRRATIAMHITPVYVGTAKQNKGIQTLLDGIGLFLPAPDEVKNYAVDLDDNENQVELIPDKSLPTVALAFKLEDGKYGQLTYMRIYQGSIKKGDMLVNIHTGRKLKVPRIVKMHASQMEDIDEAYAGDIIGMFGVECSSGDTFTDGRLNYSLTSMHIPTPVMELSIAPKERTLEANFSKALNRFQKEDPTFIVYRDEESGETIMKGMGELHLEIYVERIRREYNTEVIVGKPKVAYRETITQRADFDYTHKKQTGGAGQFARVAGYIEPLKEPNNEHYLFENKIIGGVIPKEFIAACDKGFREQLHEGFIIRQPIVDVKVTLNDGSTHPVDSSELAFKLASRSALREVLPKARPIILEPIMKLEVAVPEEFQGVVIGNLNQRRGIIHNTTLDAKYITIEADVPLREMFGYSSDLRSLTQGKGEFTMEFMKYQPVPKSIEEEIIKEYKEKEQKK
ncbi:MAG TPA: elongation factor G [Bacteroidota bacterium]|nr:elongation factor G [Bacteroidota bacterium]